MNVTQTVKRLSGREGQSGFSLIELMIVVAIIGILAAIAVPNYNRFQRKARQSEARAALGAIYTAEKAYFADYQGFTDNLIAVGFTPDGRILYNCGFMSTGMNYPVLDTSMYGAEIPTSQGVCINAVYMQDCVDTTMGIAVSSAAAVVPAGGATFASSCEANLGVVGTNDIWTMSQTKQLLNTQSGI